MPRQGDLQAMAHQLAVGRKKGKIILLEINFEARIKIMNKIIRNALLAITFAIFLQNVPYAQDSSGYLLWRFEGGTISHHYDELMLEAESFYEVHKKNGDFVIRICSKEPFILSYKFATGRVQRIYSLLKERLNVPDRNVFFARGTNCLSKVKGDIATDVWWIPKKLDFPQSVELYRSCQIKETEFSDDKKENRNDGFEYQLLALKKSLGISRKKENNISFVIGSFGVSPSKKLLAKLAKAKKMLRNEISNGRVIVRARRIKAGEAEKGEKYEYIVVVTSAIEKCCSKSKS